MFKAIRKLYGKWIVRQYEKVVANDKGKITFHNVTDDKETVRLLNEGELDDSNS